MPPPVSSLSSTTTSESARPVTSQWLKKIQLAYDFKKVEFQDDADECMRFFDGPYDWLYSGFRAPSTRGFSYFGDEDERPGPSCQMTVNKVAELVQLFGPALYHRNPVRKVNPRTVIQPVPAMFGDVQQDPMAAQMFMQAQQMASQQLDQDAMRAEILEQYLDYTPTAMDLKTNARWAIDEALIKGMGCMWTQKYQPTASAISYSASFYDSVDNLLLDPDATKFQDCKWISKRRCRPVWEVEREFGLPEGVLRGKAQMESYSQQAVIATDTDGDYRRKQGRTADLVVYWEIYSKMGLGGRLAGMDPGQKQTFDQAGDEVYLAVCDNLPYPLNLPPPFCDVLFGSQNQSDDEQTQAALQQQGQDLQGQIQERLAWPTPFWADGTWPMTPFVFHWRPGKLWPMSHMKPGIGELKFLNWAWSFLAGKVRTASRDFIAIAKSAGEELKGRIKHAGDYTIIDVEAIHGSIDNVVKFLQHPGFNPEIYKVIEGVTMNFERRVGLTELIYGSTSRQMRSAQEASVKSDMIQIRPDEMANNVEDAMTELARKEGFCARWHLRGPDVQPVLGPFGAQLWEQLLVPTDPSLVLYQLEYRIEANSARKPNKSTDMEKMTAAMNNLFSPLLNYAQGSGNVDPLNALITDWAKANDLDANRYLFPQPPPPAPPPPPVKQSAREERTESVQSPQEERGET